jgi:phosphopantetheine--protein transferase-like protein
MITGIGVDIIDRARFHNVTDKHFLGQLFNERELRAASTHHDATHWASWFALKEAVMKTFCIGLHLGSHWHDIEIHEDGGVMVSGIFTPHLKSSTVIHATRCRSKRHVIGFVLAQE